MNEINILFLNGKNYFSKCRFFYEVNISKYTIIVYFSPPLHNASYIHEHVICLFIVI